MTIYLFLLCIISIILQKPYFRVIFTAAFLTKTINCAGVSIKFDIWDTAGQERYHSLAPMYYRGAPAAVVAYDVTSSVSLVIPYRYDARPNNSFPI